MNDLIRVGTVELLRFLLGQLARAVSQTGGRARSGSSELSATAHGAGARPQDAEQLDFAALLRVLDQNWYELSSELACRARGGTG